VSHLLLDPTIVAAIEREATAHRGQAWVCDGFTDLGDRAAHPCGILHGAPFSVFAKLTSAVGGRTQFAAELAGLQLITDLSAVPTPTPVGTGIIEVPAPAPDRTGWLLLFEALPERTSDRSDEDFRAIGRALAMLHEVHQPQFGLAEFDGFFGPFPQDNQPVPTNSWPDFYAERRIRPLLKIAVDSGNLPVELTEGVERVIDDLPYLCGPKTQPSLLHGDAQQNNFLATPDGAVVIDACPYFGHPEIDLALVDYFAPVPPDLFDGYGEIRPIDHGFTGRRELWRIFVYLAMIAVDGQNPFGRQHLGRLADAIDRYR
jgi:fructosamine-3-kinase